MTQMVSCSVTQTPELSSAVSDTSNVPDAAYVTVMGPGPVADVGDAPGPANAQL